MNVAYIEEKSYIYGPGCRFVIWVQGCSIRCKGCWNREMWSFEKNTEYSVPELVNMIDTKNVEGVTILGGEPLDQLSDVYNLCSKCQQLGLSTMVFTGYELSEIDNTDKSIIKTVSDILIVGRYDESIRTIEKQWIGSTNQQILFLTKKYADYEIQDANYMEIDIEENGKCTFLGFPDTENILSHFHIPHLRYNKKSKELFANTSQFPKLCYEDYKRLSEEK